MVERAPRALALVLLPALIAPAPFLAPARAAPVAERAGAEAGGDRTARIHRLHRSLHALHDRALHDPAAPTLARALGRMLDAELGEAGRTAGRSAIVRADDEAGSWTDADRDIVDARTTSPGDGRFVAALVARALSGGDADALDAALRHPALDPALADALRLHLRRSPVAADALERALPLVPREALPLSHLALGTLRGTTRGTTRGGADHLARAALLAPGTLVEEAALRRRIALPPPSEGEAGEAVRWHRAAMAHLARFPRSAHRGRVVALVASGLASRADALGPDAALTLIDVAPALAVPLAREAVLAGASTVAEAALARAGEGPRPRTYRAAIGVVADAAAPTVPDEAMIPHADRSLVEARAAIARAIVRPLAPLDDDDPEGIDRTVTDRAVIDGADLDIPAVDEALAAAREALDRAR